MYIGDTSRSILSNLFNWKPKATVEKRKYGVGRSGKGGKRKKLSTWTHTFVCLSRSTQVNLPDGDERALLQIAGLGEKKMVLLADSEAKEIYDELVTVFPKLAGAGGFELLRIPEGGSKQLDVIAAPESGYTIPYLKAVIPKYIYGHYNKTYH